MDLAGTKEATRGSRSKSDSGNSSDSSESGLTVPDSLINTEMS